MEAINQESVVAPGDLSEAPISVTTTDTNLTGSWKFFRPCPGERQAPCAAACPLGNEIPSVMSGLLNEGPEAALDQLRRRNPLPAVTGRVCPNYCQQQCNRKTRDQEVLVGCIERYLGDLGLNRPYPAPETRRGERVAVIGSGPAGLAAAYFLATAGLSVSILERESRAGGLLRYGIPPYRLPKEVLDRELDNLIGSLNIDLQLNREILAGDMAGLLDEYDFVFCAPGLCGSIIPAEFRDGGEGVEPGLELLNRLNKGEVPSGQRFVVVGGGNVAVDVARSLIRCGKDVQIVYRRTFEEMPAYAEEKTQALEEGVQLLERRLVQSAEPAGDGGLRLTLARAENRSGRIEAGQAAGEIEADRLVLAVGQTAHMEIPEQDRLLIGGDYQTGPATVVEAMATGRDAARSVLESLDPDLAARVMPPEPELPVIDPAAVSLEFEPRRQPIEADELDAATRRSSFEEIRPSPSQETVLEAASRCLGCGTCSACGLCWFFCPDVAVSLEEGEQGMQPHIDAEHCKGCGLCAAVCPRGIIQLEEDV